MALPPPKAVSPFDVTPLIVLATCGGQEAQPKFLSPEMEQLQVGKRAIPSCRAAAEQQQQKGSSPERAMC